MKIKEFYLKIKKYILNLVESAKNNIKTLISERNIVKMENDSKEMIKDEIKENANYLKLVADRKMRETDSMEEDKNEESEYLFLCLSILNFVAAPILFVICVIDYYNKEIGSMSFFVCLDSGFICLAIHEIITQLRNSTKYLKEINEKMK